MKTITHNGVPCVEARVHRLATEDECPINVPFLLSTRGYIHKHLAGGEFRRLIKLGRHRPQHLYITDDSEIKEGDWFITDDENQDLMHAVGAQWRALCKYDGLIEMSRKVVATTDPKLTEFIDKGEGIICEQLPQIPQSFIEEYCKAGGIDKVMVEYTHPIIKWDKDDLPGVNGEIWSTKLQPKTDSNNCIIIHPVEEDKILTALQKFWNSAVIESTVKYSDLDKWIKENL